MIEIGAKLCTLPCLNYEQNLTQGITPPSFIHSLHFSSRTPTLTAYLLLPVPPPTPRGSSCLFHQLLNFNVLPGLVLDLFLVSTNSLIDSLALNIIYTSWLSNFPTYSWTSESCILMHTEHFPWLSNSHQNIKNLKLCSWFTPSTTPRLFHSEASLFQLTITSSLLSQTKSLRVILTLLFFFQTPYPF